MNFVMSCVSLNFLRARAQKVRAMRGAQKLILRARDRPSEANTALLLQKNNFSISEQYLRKKKLFYFEKEFKVCDMRENLKTVILVSMMIIYENNFSFHFKNFTPKKVFSPKKEISPKSDNMNMLS